MEEAVIIEKFKYLGLTDAAGKIYLYLLHQSNSTASEISRDLAISRPKTYEYLSRLVDKGLCTEILGKVKKYAAVNPKTAFTKIQDQVTAEYENTSSVIDKLSEYLLPIFLKPNEHSDPMDYIQVIRERNSIIDKFETLEKSAQNEILSLVKLPFVMDMKSTLNPVEFDVLKGNVTFKTIYNREDVQHPQLMKAIRKFAEAGEDVRITNQFPIPFKMYIFDNKTVMFTLEDLTATGSKLTALIIEHLDLVKGLKNVFDLYWINSSSLSAYLAENKME
ncbi:MAG TPA: helix-turn-helix domain-containing protein [Candidatus Cloacimonadota bacterium]|nr:helix-turn-helix domain-containing protein [Candidatus Cloacimonadota bacterium]